MRITVFANRITIGIGNPDPPPPPTRGEIKGFSKASRKRLLDKINSVRNLEGALFVTLTYPDNFPRHPQQWKIHIANFRKRLERQYPHVGGIWRLELKARKSGVNIGQVAPHFHVIMRGVTGSLQRTRRWVACAWYEVVKSGDVKHALAGTNVKPCQNRNHAAWYVAKYVAKIDDDKHVDAQTGERLWTGRMWGAFGHLYCEEYIRGQISHSRYKFFRSVLAGWVERGGNSDYANTMRGAEHGFTLYGFGPEGAKWPELVNLLRHCNVLEDTYAEAV